MTTGRNATEDNMTETIQSPIIGLHHVTAITASAQRNHDFYTRALGLRLVKRTVNFDDPGAWHLYYADGAGTPGTVMTFFAWPGGKPGRQGAGQVTETQFAVPSGALPLWAARIPAMGGSVLGESTVMGEQRLTVTDPDGLRLALVETDDPRTPWLTEGIDAAHAIRGFRGVTLTLQEAGGVTTILRDVFGYAQTGQDDPLTRLTTAAESGVVDIVTDPQARPGTDGAGAVHHVAFRVPDRAAQLAVRARMQEAGLRVTPPIDRDYFWAIYARTPGGVLFEVATDEPGFTIDEAKESLGTELRLPRQYEHLRAAIEEALPPLTA
jgi:glyoxalase family protein